MPMASPVGEAAGAGLFGGSQIPFTQLSDWHSAGVAQLPPFGTGVLVGVIVGVVVEVPVRVGVEVTVPVLVLVAVRVAVAVEVTVPVGVLSTQSVVLMHTASGLKVGWVLPPVHCACVVLRQSMPGSNSQQPRSWHSQACPVDAQR